MKTTLFRIHGSAPEKDAAAGSATPAPSPTTTNGSAGPIGRSTAPPAPNATTRPERHHDHRTGCRPCHTHMATNPLDTARRRPIPTAPPSQHPAIPSPHPTRRPSRHGRQRRHSGATWRRRGAPQGCTMAPRHPTGTTTTADRRPSH